LKVHFPKSFPEVTEIMTLAAYGNPAVRRGDCLQLADSPVMIYRSSSPLLIISVECEWHRTTTIKSSTDY